MRNKNYPYIRRTRRSQRWLTRRHRLGLVSCILAVWLIAVIARMFVIQVSGSDTWKISAKRQHLKPFTVSLPRRPIYDRNGNLLSLSVPVGSVYVRPRLIKRNAMDLSNVVEYLSNHLDIPIAKVKAAFNDSRPFVWLARQIPLFKAKKIRDLKIMGLNYVEEFRRYYPYGSLAAALIGKVNIDGHGVTGIERMYDDVLIMDSQELKVALDGLGKFVYLGNDKVTHISAFSSVDKGLALTIDAVIQGYLQKELEAGRVNAQAKSASGAIIDVNSGEILALGQAPFIEMNELGADPKGLRSKIIEDVYEPGSTIKPFILAAAIEKGIVAKDDIFNCENGAFKFGRHIIHDVHPSKVLTAQEIIVRSSNIGIAKIGLKLGEDNLYSYFTKLGFGVEAPIRFYGATRGLLRKREGWTDIDIVTHSFGQGFAISGLQLLRAFSSFVNGGFLPNLRVISDDITTASKRRIWSENTAKILRETLIRVVEDPQGTGRNARLENIIVGGKTGTAQKPRRNGRGYEADKYVASFIGFIDARALGVKRVLAMIITVDEPMKGKHYGSAAAAPIFRRVAQKVVRYLAGSSYAFNNLKRDREVLGAVEEPKTHNTTL